ncbi:MAG: aldehyde dehydrogenase family protein [Zoogloeaceae bacterium]|nr:aldehyde dehydrogenase family protein [Zoogloeaceae bacterium]
MLLFSPDDAPPALPCWINGHAFLSMTREFVDVCDVATGRSVRRTPLCGDAEAAEAVAAARAVASMWRALDARARDDLLAAWSAALAQYAAHFARLLRQETGVDEVAAHAEVAEAVQALRNDAASRARDNMRKEVFFARVGRERPLVMAARALAPVLREGMTVVVNPDAKAPGVVYALVELSARAGLPPGVVNLVQGGEAVREALSRRLSGQAR